jgi:hypothetical protein
MIVFMLGFRAALAGALGFPLLLACGAGSPSTAAGSGEPTSGGAAFGTLAMPLATIVNGIRYRLTTDRFSLSGPIEQDLQHNGDGSIVVAALPEGDYEVTLHDGWVLERQAETGFEAVVAELVSPNPRAVHIDSEQTTTVAWLFQTDGTPLSLEQPPGLFQGNLAVADSTNPATVIFGDVLAAEAAHVDALAGIASIDGSLTLEADVSSLAALAALTDVAADLRIHGTALTSLAGLDSLAEVGGSVSITDNSQLPTCVAEALVVRLGIDPAEAQISGNDDAGACP